ncbi:hypothetical protein QCE62_07140 [Caballeronia sp. LZ033]|uniref:hypothetical protein n=1 Tax=Caballeronia sp. LZ033 TaxID=3038566 RepID=UPI00285758F0|nr:hypothetical protein [Caballeronia sp. LZ033]MDR5813367.1 hypothetical protein [Caballeronia sp. LZ033]
MNFELCRTIACDRLALKSLIASLFSPRNSTRPSFMSCFDDTDFVDKGIETHNQRGDAQLDFIDYAIGNVPLGAHIRGCRGNPSCDTFEASVSMDERHDRIWGGEIVDLDAFEQAAHLSKVGRLIDVREVAKSIVISVDGLLRSLDQLQADLHDFDGRAESLRGGESLFLSRGISLICGYPNRDDETEDCPRELRPPGQLLMLFKPD